MVTSEVGHFRWVDDHLPIDATFQVKEEVGLTRTAPNEDQHIRKSIQVADLRKRKPSELLREM